MTTERADRPETLAEFKDSFAYGSRNDLNFKFLKRLSDADAGRFFQELLAALGETLDDGDFGRLTRLVVAWQAKAYSGHGKYGYDDGPFTPLSKPLSDCRLALVTSTGHFVQGDDPVPLGDQGMTQAEAVRRIAEFVRHQPQLSKIPYDTPRERLVVRHGGYDIKGVQADPNVALPLDRLTELASQGTIGGLLPNAYSFVGAAAQTPLIGPVGRQWAETLSAAGADAAVLVPV